MPYASVNSQKLFYEDTGGDLPALVFSHGLLMDRTMFAAQVEAFRDSWRCIAWDERAHGKTATDTIAPFTYYDSANDLAALLDSLDIEQAVLAGMSQGGFLSLRAALTHPGIVRALILIDTQSGVEDPAVLSSTQQLVDNWIEGDLPDDIATQIVDTILLPNWPDAQTWVDKWRAMAPANVTAAFQTLVTRDDITDKMPSITVPSLIIHGDADKAIPIAKGKALQKAIKNSHMATIVGAGHASNLTHPIPVNIAIDSFLKDLKP